MRGNKPGVPPAGRTKNLMPTQPGTYRADNPAKRSYDKLMSRESIERDVKSEIVSPKKFKMKRAAKQQGKFKGFKI